MYSFRKRLVHWYTGTVVSEEGESDNRASVFGGCLMPYKAHVSREWGDKKPCLGYALAEKRRIYSEDRLYAPLGLALGIL